jgi:plastocyanin domain-containing protein
MDKIIVSSVGIAFIGAIYWFFFGKIEKSSSETHILVDGGYKPSVIRIPQGKSTTLTFVRKDPNTCLEDFYIPDFKIKEYLPMNKPVVITLTPPSKGTFGFHCGMNMFHGKIEVV